MVCFVVCVGAEHKTESENIKCEVECIFLDHVSDEPEYHYSFISLFIISRVFVRAFLSCFCDDPALFFIFIKDFLRLKCVLAHSNCCADGDYCSGSHLDFRIVSLYEI